MKKAELASLAEREIAGTGWLPVPLRIADSIADSSDTELSEDDPDEIAEAAE
jgi:hypothetical protein